MIRILNTYPQCGDIVIAKITRTNKTSQMHDCVLLEYGNMPAKIIKANCNNKDARKVFLNIQIGMIMPLVCQETPAANDLFTAVSYPTLDKETVDKYKEKYSGIMRIINTIIMMMYIPSENNSESCRPDKIIENNDSIRNTVQAMTNEIIDSFDTLDDVIDAFLTDTTKLHEVAKNWQTCVDIPDFHKKLIIKFPLPKESITLRFEYVNYNCNGILGIHKMIAKVEQLICQYDSKVTVSVAIDTVPYYRIYIKKIDTECLTTYAKALKEMLFVEQNYDTTYEVFRLESEELHTSRNLAE